MVTAFCITCGAGFEYETAFSGRFVPELCPDCQKAKAEKLKQTQAKEALATRVEAWKLACPPLYQATDITRLPKEPTEKTLAWKFGAQGLVLHGPTGTGKTRAALLLAKRLFVDEARSLVLFHGNKFAHECARKFGEQEGEAWIEWLSRQDVLVFDDLGKFKLTERVEAELFGLIETRIAYFRPVIATTNFGGDGLAVKLSEDRGEPLVRRLREFCQGITFK